MANLEICESDLLKRISFWGSFFGRLEVAEMDNSNHLVVVNRRNQGIVQKVQEAQSQLLARFHQSCSPALKEGTRYHTWREIKCGFRCLPNETYWI